MDENMKTGLSKMMSYALRHHPEEFDLTLDNMGWTFADLLLEGIKRHSFKYRDINIDDIKRIVAEDSKGRYELTGGRIRAVYGHSIPEKVEKPACEPPDILYHGTTENFAKSIRIEGLKPMNRQYVHLSTDAETASIVAKRRKGPWVILKVRAKEAYKDGIKFYRETNGIWLSDSIPARYIG